MFFLLYGHTNDGVIDDFPKNSDHYFPKISEDSLKFVRSSHERCRTFSKNFQRLPKIAVDCRRSPKTFEEDPKIFRSYTNEFKYNLRDKLDISERIDILNNEDMENTPLESRMWFRMNFTSGVFSSKNTRVYISSLSLKLYLNSLVYDRNIFRSSSKVFGDLRQSSAIFSNLWKCLENVRQRLCELRKNFGESSEILGKLSDIFGKSSITLSLVCPYIIKRTLHFSSKI